MNSRNSRLRIVLISGPICSGKSALAQRLGERHDARIVKTRDLIVAKRPKTKNERTALQRAGQQLDGIDGGIWVAEALQQMIDDFASEQTPHGLFVIDSVRIQGQVDAIRKAYGADVHHVHVTATAAELERRYNQRTQVADVNVDYSE